MMLPGRILQFLRNVSFVLEMVSGIFILSDFFGSSFVIFPEPSVPLVEVWSSGFAVILTGPLQLPMVNVRTAMQNAIFIKLHLRVK
jgi:hypothetical protein